MSANGSKHLSGPERAATLLLILGEEHGAPLWDALDDEELRLVTQAMTRLGSVNADTIEEVLVELANRHGLLAVHGDYQRAQALMRNVLPKDRLDPILSDLGAPKGRTIWQRLANVREELLANHLKSEHPQAVAVIMTRIKPAHAAKVLALLPESLVGDVLIRMMNIESVSREVIEMVEESLRVNFIATLTQGVRRNSHEMMAEIFNALDTVSEARLMDALRSQNEFAADKVRSAMFTFEDITRLDPNSAQVLLRAVDKADLAKALKGASASTREFFISKMTQRSATIFRDEMQGMGPIRLKEVDEAQQRIITLVKSLEDRGELTIARGGEDEMILE